VSEQAVPGHDVVPPGEAGALHPSSAKVEKRVDLAPNLNCEAKGDAEL
jgi:hypothetical protein